MRIMMEAKYEGGNAARAAQHASNISESNTVAETGDAAAGRFPLELYRMLDTVASRGMDGLVCWQEDGTSFMIHNKPEFERVVMPIFFHRLKYSSFKRLLHLHGFKSVSQRGKEKGAFTHPNFLKGRTDLLNSIQKSEKKRSSPKSEAKSSGKKRSEFGDSDSDEATNIARLLSRSSKVSGSAKKARRTSNATVKQKSNPHGASESASPMASPTSSFIDRRADDLQGSPQNALRVLLASQDVSAVSMGPLGETAEFQDNQTGNISGSFLSSVTDQSQAAMIGQGVHQAAAHYPGQQQVGWNQEHDSLSDTIMSMRLLQQQQQQELLQLQQQELLQLQQQELLQLQLQSQQQQSQGVTGDLAYQSPQMMQHFLERQVANGYNSFQTGAIGGGRFDMNIGPNFPGQPMIMDVNSRSQAGIWDNVLEPRPLAPHALQPPVGVPNVLGRSSNVGENKSNEFEEEDGLISYILSNPGAPNFETNQGETKTD